MNSRIIVALDGMEWAQAIRLAEHLSGKVYGFKVNDLFLSPSCRTDKLRQYGKVMVDLKFYDIPATITNLMKRVGEADLVTVHASSGPAGLEAAVKAADVETGVLAVTALTSFTDADLANIYGSGRSVLVQKLGRMAMDAGCTGLVCAYPDLEVFGGWRMLKVCPGFRRPDDNRNDQVHTGTGAGADLVVVGRPITQAADPVRVTDEINALLATS
jgi:orotidine-5'-phosphate decarboxylase